MNRCYFQRWEESERSWGIRPDGCSLHINEEAHKSYLNEIYIIRQGEALVSHEYDRITGPLIECFISDTLFELVKEKNSLRLMEYEMNNLIKIEDIFFKV
jgi:hypothetical protein